MTPSQHKRIKLWNACNAAEECGAGVFMAAKVHEAYFKQMDHTDQDYFQSTFFEDGTVQIETKP